MSRASAREGFAHEIPSRWDFLGIRRSCPKNRVDPKLVHLVNQDDEIMAEKRKAG